MRSDVVPIHRWKTAKLSRASRGQCELQWPAPRWTILCWETTGAVGGCGFPSTCRSQVGFCLQNRGCLTARVQRESRTAAGFCSHVVLGSRRPPKTKENTSKTKTLSVKVPKQSTHASLPRTEEHRRFPQLLPECRSASCSSIILLFCFANTAC